MLTPTLQIVSSGQPMLAWALESSHGYA